jgi:hypothetical protein
MISTDGNAEPQIEIQKNRIRQNMTLIRYPFTSNHEAIGLTTVFFEELPMPKPLFRGVKAALNRIGPPVGDPQPRIQPLPEAHQKTPAEMLVNLGYEVHMERMG